MAKTTHKPSPPSIHDRSPDQVCVAELMHADAATVPSHASMPQAAQILVDNHQQGACVVNELGYCIGVLSAWDFVRLEKERESICDLGSMGSVHDLIRGNADAPYSLAADEYEGVRRHMSSFVQTIDRQASVAMAAHVMCESGIHQLVVLDDDNRPLGLITSNQVTKFAMPHDNPS